MTIKELERRIAEGLGYKDVKKLEKGGPGSGNFGHEGVPGQVGGSAPGGGGERNDFGDIETMDEVYAADDFGRTKLDPNGEDQKRWANSREALDDYQGSGYADVNLYLRTGEGNSDLEGEEVADLDKAMNELNADVIVYRGMGFSGYQKISDNLVEGAVFQDKAFVSTSLIKDTAEDVGGRKVIFRIKVPKGSKGFYYDKRVNERSNEHELLLARNCRFKITSVKYDKGDPRVDAELVGQGD